jgi:hypothetical protein
LPPQRSPRATIRSLNQFLRQVLESADVQEKFLSIGVEVTPGPPENLTALVKSDMARFGKVTQRIPDPLELRGTSAAEGIAVDAQGNVYGAEAASEVC